MGYVCQPCLDANLHSEYGACGHPRAIRTFTDAVIRPQQVTPDELEHLRPVSTFPGEQPQHIPGQYPLFGHIPGTSIPFTHHNLTN